jgi:NAD(P)-dependent dehydrogenase (short-subunit alcohol dehydrogenase family)
MSSPGVMIVTGGSRGIGAATARLAAERGYAVCISYLNAKSQAEKLLAEINSKGKKAIAVQGDVAVEADVVRLFQETDRQLGRVTALVNNAGIVAAQSRVEDMRAERIERMLAVNVLGSFLCAREAVKRMSTRYGGSGGAIVNVSSGAARLGSPGEYVDYAASKGAVDTMTLGLAKEVAADGIRVNAVRPGFVHTDIHAAGGEPNRIERLRDTIPMKRGGEPEEIAHAILWLLSDEASFSTGAILDATGGR